MNKGKVTGLNSFPIKGLSAEKLDEVTLHAGNGFPGDRMFGLAKASSGFDPENPKPLPKDRFIVLAQHAKLATLSSRFNPDTNVLVVSTKGKVVLECEMSEPEGQQAVSDFLTDLLQLTADERPTFASAAPHRFTDVSVVSEAMMNTVSLINQTSVHDFSAKIEKPVQVERFRSNIVFEGWDPFSELDLVDREVSIGTVRLKLVKRTKRCPATQVNPITAERDIQLPALLRKTYGHFDMGVYAEVLQGGTIALGDDIQVI